MVCTTFRRRFLQHKTASAALDDTHDIIRVGIHREDQHLHLGHFAAQEIGHRQTVHLRHVDVHQDYVRFEFVRLVQRVPTVSGFAENLDARMFPKTHPQAAADNRMIIYNQRVE